MSPCATCQNLTFCYTCVSTSQFLYSNNSCYATCSSGAYGSGIASYNTTINSVLRCFPCDSTCSSCNDSNYCLYCTNPSLIANLLTGQCVSTCPDGYYNNSGQCFKCGSTCGKCSNSFSCLTCIDSLVYSLTSTSQCVENCPGQVPVGGVCMCGTDCVNCSGTVTNCVSCVSGRLLQGSDCVSSCSGAAYSSNGVCYSCPTGCAACTASACSSCISTYYFLNGACHDDCPSSLGSGYVNNPSNQSCEKCTAGCSMCDPQNLSNCSSCLTNYSFNPVTRLC
jgi:proprotein convertase subtilisin/kexin type 5